VSSGSEGRAGGSEGMVNGLRTPDSPALISVP
jgi:hypothetical protein